MSEERRSKQAVDRRQAPRGGRRTGDGPGRHPRILVAERYDGAREPFVRYLDNFGFKIEQVRRGDEFLAAAKATQPALIIAELAMPIDADGPLVKRLADDRANEEQVRHIPIIGLVDMEEEDAATRARLPQLAGVLVKPFSLATMLQQVRKVLRQRATP